ncbi:hypothetical protein [Actinomadura fibrosa]|uniref:Uncharacterized protein n=1 Tax=Actinomadura fibrosa TaxID=111802 RepID=A0ABW2XKL1_9ACTN|nr:hypothetical protein [Actinomadura fibrosa]
MDPRTTPLIVLGRDAAGHYLVGACASCGGGVIEKYSFDDWDTGAPETYDMYWWWRMDAADTAAFREMLRPCPAPLDPDCACPIHESLRAETPRPLPPATNSSAAPAEVPRTRWKLTDGIPHWTEPA